MKSLFSHKVCQLIGRIALGLLIIFVAANSMNYFEISFPVYGILAAITVVGLKGYSTLAMWKEILYVILLTLVSLGVSKAISKLAYDDIKPKYEGVTSLGTTVIINPNTLRVITVPRGRTCGAVTKIDSLMYDGIDSSGNPTNSIITAFRGGKPKATVFVNPRKAYIHER